MAKFIAGVVFVWNVVAKFIGPSSGTGKDVLNSQDVFKVIFGPKVVAIFIALVILVLQGVGAVVASVNIPVISWLALWVGGMVIELLRRLPQYDARLIELKSDKHGTEVTRTPSLTDLAPAPMTFVSTPNGGSVLWPDGRDASVAYSPYGVATSVQAPKTEPGAKLVVDGTTWRHSSQSSPYPLDVPSPAAKPAGE